mmetsp:Transcript_3164/g.3588  ORF Transcript_3164/g.3588 Transcript_3164/m.3588 type:complete len:99 (+) Transcript_3164:40-336(+)
MKFSTRTRLALLLVGFVGTVASEKTEDWSALRHRERRQLTATATEASKHHWHEDDMKNKSRAKDFIKEKNKPSDTTSEDKLKALRQNRVKIVTKKHAW